MDDESANLEELGSPGGSSSEASQDEDVMEQTGNAGAEEQEMDSGSESNEEMDTSNSGTVQRQSVDTDRGKEQFQTTITESDNEMESETRESTISDEHSGQKLDIEEPEQDAEVALSPMQSSVSEVSSENDEAESSRVSEEQKKGYTWENEKNIDQQLFTGYDSPKEEKLDYGPSDEEDEIDERHGNESPLSDVNIDSSTNVLDRRKSPSHEKVEENMDNVSQEDDEGFTSKATIHEGEVDDVSDQSGEESADDQSHAASPKEEKREMEEDKDERLDDVSDQSDSDAEPVVTSDRTHSDEVDKSAVQEDLDDVSDQSEVEAPKVEAKDEEEEAEVALDDVSDSENSELDDDDQENKLLGKVEGDVSPEPYHEDLVESQQRAVYDPSPGKEVAENEETDVLGGAKHDAERDLDDVSDSDDNELDENDAIEKEQTVRCIETPPEEMTQSKETVLVVHHHRDQGREVQKENISPSEGKDVAQKDLDDVSDSADSDSNESVDDQNTTRNVETLAINKISSEEMTQPPEASQYHREQGSNPEVQKFPDERKEVDEGDLDDVSDSDGIDSDAINQEQDSMENVEKSPSNKIAPEESTPPHEVVMDAQDPGHETLNVDKSEADKDIDDVSYSDDSDSVDDGQGKDSSEKVEDIPRDETPPPESPEHQEAVVDVHHPGDELDFEEDVEERVEEEAYDKVDREGKIEAVQEKKDEVAKEAAEVKDEELESGEEGETKDDDDDDGEAGEIEDDDDAEEGEVKDPDEKKPAVKPVCRFFTRGQCTWGPKCRFLHPGYNNYGNYSFIDFKEIEQNTAKLLNIDLNPAPPPVPDPLPEEIIMPEELFPPPPIPEEPRRESVWERGIRQAKEMRKKAERMKELGIREEPRYVVEETYDDFDMEAEFNPDIHKSTAEQYGYSMEPDPEYNPRREMRERQRETRAPPRREQPPPPHQKRPEPYHEPKYRDNRNQRKDQFGRDFEKRRDPHATRTSQRSDLPKQYPPGKPVQERGRREERTIPTKRVRKPADAWQDPWARTKSPKPKTKVPAKGRNRSGSLSSGSSVSRSRSKSYSSGSSRSSSASSYSSRSDSRSPSPAPRRTQATKTLGLQPREKPKPGLRKPAGEVTKFGLKKPPGAGEKPAPVKKLGLQLPPQKPMRRSRSNSSISSASRSRSKSLSPSHSRAGAPKAGRRRRRRSSGSSHVTVSSKSSNDSERLYANLASPVSSPSSLERTPKKKTKGAKVRKKFPSSKPTKSGEAKSSRPKAMVTVPSMEAFREPPIQLKKTAKLYPKVTPDPKLKPTSAPAQMTSRNPVKLSVHKDIKLTLLNKPSDSKKRYEVLGEGAAKKVKPVAPVKPTTKVMMEKERRPVKPIQQPAKKMAPSVSVSPVKTAAVKPSISERSERKRPPSPFKQKDQPPAKAAHKTGSSGASKSRDPAAAKKATISRREEILKQLKAVEDMIARKKAKMKN